MAKKFSELTKTVMPELPPLTGDEPYEVGISAPPPPTCTIFFDMDDTLIECSRYYREALAEGGALIEQLTKIPAERATRLIADLDLAAIAQNPTFAKERFPRSFEAAMAAAYILVGAEPDWGARQRAFSTGLRVFSADYAQKNGVAETLVALRQKGYRLVLVTKGDAEVQESKINRHGYRELFDAIHVVANKSVDVWAGILQQENADPHGSMVVGDSLKDDIAPAKALGLVGVHIVHSDSWSYNDAPVIPDHIIKSIPEVLDVVAAGVEPAEAT